MHSWCWPLITSPPALAPAAVQTAWRTSQWGQHWSSRRQRWMGYPSMSAGHIWTEGCTACSSGKQAQVTWLCGHFKCPGCWLAPDTGGSRAQCLVVSSHSSLSAIEKHTTSFTSTAVTSYSSNTTGQEPFVLSPAAFILWIPQLPALRQWMGTHTHSGSPSSHPPAMASARSWGPLPVASACGSWGADSGAHAFLTELQRTLGASQLCSCLCWSENSDILTRSDWGILFTWLLVGDRRENSSLMKCLKASFKPMF